MAGTITHNYILFRALQDYNAPTDSPIALVQASNERMYDYACQDRYKQYVRDPVCLPASCSYLGCCGPDLFYLENGNEATHCADIMHYNRTGLYMIWCLQAAKLFHWVGALTDPLYGSVALRQFAYCLGHICHIAADICVHPYVNSIVGAYPDNKKLFDAAPSGIASVKGNVWKFHNILEHHQDSYIWHKRFVGDAGFDADWENINMARGAAAHYRKKRNRGERFLVENCTTYYHLPKLPESVEMSRYGFFTMDTSWINASWYFEDTLPSVKMVDHSPVLVQGGGDGLFDQYVADAVSQTKAFWVEVDAYLKGKQEHYNDILHEDKKLFRALRKHWNLDTGFYPEASAAGAGSWLSGPDQNENLETRLCVAGQLAFKSVFTDPKTDLAGS